MTLLLVSSLSQRCQIAKPDGYRTRAGPSSRLHPLVSAGPSVTAPHSHCHVNAGRTSTRSCRPASPRPQRVARAGNALRRMEWPITGVGVAKR